MPMKPLKACKHPGCPNLTKSKYCDDHKKLDMNRRSNANSRGYGSKWRKARNRFLKANPLCESCKRIGAITRASVVDHKIPHRGDQKLFWDESNWQALCKRCHDKKTMTEDVYIKYKY